MAGAYLHAALVLLSVSIVSCSASPAATTTTTSGFPAVTDTENTGAFEGGASSRGSGPTAGADGADGGLKLSTGAIIGIAVAIAVICIAFIILWALWFTAKRRNWAVRDTLKYASRRLTGRGAVPPTPKTPHTPHPARRAVATTYTGQRKGGARVWPSAGQRAAVKPHAGWLEEEEKELSRSVTLLSRGRR